MSLPCLRNSSSAFLYDSCFAANRRPSDLRLFAPALAQHLQTYLNPRRARYTTTAAATQVIHNNVINPPASTLPAPLVLPVREPNQSLFSYLYRSGKGYLSFYKTGVVNVYKNAREANALLSRISKKPKGSHVPTRAEFQLVQRSRRDLRRLVPFALILAVCGEWTPFIVILVPGLVPGNCQIPKQVVSQREKRDEARAATFRRISLTPPPAKEKSLEQLPKESLKHIATSLGLTSGRWPVVPPLLQRRVRKRFGYILEDDDLIAKGGGVGGMEMEEIRMALTDRGISLKNLNDSQARTVLNSWLEDIESEGIVRLCLMSPTHWSTRKRTGKTWNS